MFERPNRTVEPGKDPQLDFREAEPRSVFPVSDPVVAGQCQFESASKAETMDRSHDRNLHPLDAIEEGEHGFDGGFDFGFRGKIVEFSNIGTGDEIVFLAGHDH